MFDAKEKAALLKSESYNSYVTRLKDLPIHLQIRHGKLYLEDARGIAPPMFKQSEDFVTELKAKKATLMTQYMKLYHRILVDETNPSAFKAQYNAVVDEIKEIEADIEQVYKYQSEVTLKPTDNSTKKEQITYFITKLPGKVEHMTPGKGVKPEKRKKPEKPAKPAKKPEKQPAEPEEQPKKPEKRRRDQPALNPDQVAAIVSNSKKLVKATERFKFKNVEECLSRKAAVFMSKDEIVKVIDNHPDLKRMMPEKYKTLTKEKLCELLYKKN